MFENLKGYGAAREKALRRKAAVIQTEKVRAYNMAQQNRLTNDWLAIARSFNYDIKAGGAAMLARGRELFQNDPYARKIVRSFKKGIVGPSGFVLRNKGGEWIRAGDDFKFVQDKVANAMINEAWRRWGKKKYSSIEGDETFRHFCGTLARTVFIDGEIFIKKLAGKKYNKFGFTTQLITSEYCDWRLSKKLPNGNWIVMGIEVTPGWKKVAYWFRKNNPYSEVQYSYNWSANYDRIPAEKIIHLFPKETAHQLRGITLFAPIGIRLKMLYGFEEGALIRSRASANIPWVLQHQKDALAPPGVTGDSKDSDGNIIQELEQGQIYKLDEGWEAKNLESDYPHAMHKSFTDVNLHGAAAGSDMAYSTVSSNYAGMNYTVSRTAQLDERDGWKDMQSWFAENLLSPIFTTWLEMAILSGQLNLPPNKMEKFDKPEWGGRGWKWVDPKKEAEANIIALQSFQKTFEQILTESGYDVEEQLDQIVSEKKLFEDRGLGDLYNLLMTKYVVQPDGLVDATSGNNGNGKAKTLIYNDGH